MPDTPNLGLPLLAAAQAQKHVTHNEALFAIDALLHCAILDRDLAAPPGAPAEGARYIVGPTPTGLWAGKSDLIAAWQDGAWLYLTPRTGVLAYVVDEALLYVFVGAGWVSLTAALASIQNLGRLGIGTTADAANPFAAKLNAALWTARTAGEGGTGDLRYTLNKESAANVLSLLFQSGFSGRLELGLIGSDAPSVKVSPDGSTWRTALTVDPASGGVDYLSDEAALASAATTDLGSVPHRRVAITGTATIASFGTAPNRERLLRFTGAATLTHHPPDLGLPGAADIATAAGDCAYATSDAAGRWTVRHYSPAAQPPGRATVVAELLGQNGYRKWSDGWLQQWGAVSANSSGQGNVTFPTPFNNAASVYRYGITLFGNYTTASLLLASWVSGVTATTMTTQHRYDSSGTVGATNDGGIWFAEGF